MTNEIPDIFHTDIILADYDAFWNEANDLLPDKDSRSVLIVIKPYEPGSNEEVVLNNLLAACKLSAKQYHLLQLRESMVAWYQLKTHFKPKIVLLIGILPAHLGILAMFSLNGVNRYDGCLWIPALSITDMEVHKEMKTQFWVNALRPLFIEGKYDEVEIK